VATSGVHEIEVRQGERFRFGKNWTRFLSHLTDARIGLAEQSLRTYLDAERLDGSSFLDIGSGSGLFSLAARRLGARVHSFDYDPQSVACTRELKRRYFPDDQDWMIEEGSVLDQGFLRRLGQFDIIYSWGVLHHTGAMWEALENAKSLVPVGGKLFIAIYNDQGKITDQWARVKQTYNALPGPIASLYAWAIITRHEFPELWQRLIVGQFKDWLHTWTRYDRLTMRGMSRWHDWVDWIGGYPYERAKIEQIVDVCSKDGFRLTKLFDGSSGYGCNEFVFTREAPNGTYIEARIAGSSSISRRFGWRVIAPFEIKAGKWTGRLPRQIRMDGQMRLYLFRDDNILGSVRWVDPERVELTNDDESRDSIEGSAFYVVAAREYPFTAPFTRSRGQTWSKDVPELEEISNNSAERRRSPVFVFEDDRQLPSPHALHDEIAKFGAGRFSHWGSSLYFSTTDGSDPNVNGRNYRLFSTRIADSSSISRRYGCRVIAPFEIKNGKWTACLPRQIRTDGQTRLYLFRDDNILGSVRWVTPERLELTNDDESRDSIEGSAFYVVAAVEHPFTAPFTCVRGKLWDKAVPELAEVSDNSAERRRSPVFVFENDRQLSTPHALHDDIANFGAGRFSHWESSLYFSTTDGSDPNANGRNYRLFSAAKFAPSTDTQLIRSE
jgi:2-polyprenyl-6-hydroxyphenyl methylase/3-demethylubiquinone-9 3-methyltransferase